MKVFNGIEWIDFESKEAALNFIYPNGLPQQTERTVEQDIELGKTVILEYLRENKELYISTEQSVGQLQKFLPIKSLLEVGALREARDLIFLLEVDDIFTQVRKDKYLGMLNQWL